jgi:hypothetical protein
MGLAFFRGHSHDGRRQYTPKGTDTRARHHHPHPLKTGVRDQGLGVRVPDPQPLVPRPCFNGKARGGRRGVPPVPVGGRGTPAPAGWVLFIFDLTFRHMACNMRPYDTHL